jgi:cytochrome P450
MSIGSTITLADLSNDPFPIYRKLRGEAPVCYVPDLKKWLVTRWEDCKYIEQNHDIFSTREDPSLMTRTFGLSMLRTDGLDHKRLRGAVEGALRPKVVKDVWTEILQKDAEELLETQYARGEMDLVADFAGPFAARTLKHLLSMWEASDAEMVRWSMTFMDGIANFKDDPEVWGRVEEANQSINGILDKQIPRLASQPYQNALSGMVEAGLGIEEIRANAKLFISGGLNEPRDAISGAVWALLTYPEQLTMLRGNPALYKNVAEEIFRWLSPVGAYPRTTTCDTSLGGVQLEKDAKIMVVVASANRDESKWHNPDLFDITRDNVQSHMGFSVGSHYCVGAWVARAQMMVAMPLLMERLPNLRIDKERPGKMWGFGFRGLTSFHVKWDS